MKNFQKFLEEVSIKGNPGVPGEGERQPGDKDYLSDIERRAKDRMGLTGREHPGQFVPRLMELVGLSQNLTRGSEDEVENLAKDIILSNYGDILEGVELDIKLVRSGNEVANFMQQQKCEGGACPPPPNFRRLTDPEVIKRIHKAKLANNIIQGEAKNTKHILHTDEVKEGLRQIFGEGYTQIFNIWDEISKIADKLDWVIPIEHKADMMERAPQGMAGAVALDWVPEENEEENEEEDDEEFNVEDDAQVEEEESYTPVIRSRGIDFPMLLHETVKGIYELIASVSQPGMDASEKEISDAETVKLNVTSFLDEAEDFRTGPEIAADLRDFINANPNSTYNKNMREFVFGKMMDPNYMTSTEFLDLFRGILNKTTEARTKVDKIIDEVIAELKSYELDQALPGQSIDYNVDDVDGGETIEPVSEPEQDLSQLSQRKIQELIDDALDAGDFEEVRKISQYLKEGKEIYLRELERINESHDYHTRRK